MTVSVPTRVLALLTVLVLTALLPASTGNAEERTSAEPSAHRIVWDQWKPDRSGIHLYSANSDGSEVRRVYSRAHGFTMDLILDRAARRVAFSLCCRDHFPRMLVVPLDGGPVQRPLARHHEFYFVGGIGWSPDGNRLAFEGGVMHGEEPVSSLWTVRPDGTDLRHVIDLPRDDDYQYINHALAWTREGILYSDGLSLRVARDGASHLLVRHITSVQISGDGRHLLLARWVHDRGSLWIARADGSHRQKMLMTRPDARTTYSWLTLNHNGRRVIAERSRYRTSTADQIDDVVTWKVSDGPETAEVIDMPRAVMALTWS